MRYHHATLAALCVAFGAGCATDATDTSVQPSGSQPANATTTLTLWTIPISYNVAVAQGSNGAAASVGVAISGTNAWLVTWSATASAAWGPLTNGSGRGNGSVAWARNVAALVPGLYVDTIRVTGAGVTGSPAVVYDTVRILATGSPPPPPAVTITTIPGSRNITVAAGSAAAGASVSVAVAGVNAWTVQWSVTRTAPWATLAASTGQGNGTVTWSRNTTGLAAGLYVDTIRISAGASGPSTIALDSLRVTGALPVVTLAVSPASRSTSIVQGSSAPAGSAAVTLTGTGGAQLPWTATKSATWATLTTASGTGSGTVAWNRNASGLIAGTYVDTISVTALAATGSPARVLDTLIVTPVAGGGPRPDVGLNADMRGKPFFPAASLWNQPVDTAQVDPNSAAILGAIGLTKSLHPDFGANYNGGPFGIPYIVVPDAQPRVSLPFDYAGESDAGPYPIPANPPIEPGGGDQHLLMVTQDEWKLYELFDLTQVGAGWHAGSGAIWNLATGAPRPTGWTSADAAGLPILPGLVRYDEVYLRGAINHALRFTVQRSRHAFVAPASHYASSSTNPLYAPMGMRVRLRAGFNIAAYPAPAQVILRALQKYGMMVADNGSDFFLSGTADARWDDSVINLLKQVKVSDFEVVQMTGIVTQ